MTPELGTLARVDLRQAWETEAQHFTPWLARRENIRLLGDAIGVELEVEAQEHDVGPFRADILCRDAGGEPDSWVLIENQIERTDHKHLGQLLTYAAGLRAATIVWIAERFTEEHRAALDWLNEITSEHFTFFGLEIELWRIGDSPAAPKFNVVCKPNDWAKAVMEGAREVDLVGNSDVRQLQLDYWKALAAYLANRPGTLKSRKPRAQHWTTFSIGRAGFFLSADIHIREKFIQCGLVIRPESADPKRVFKILYDDRAGIEHDAGTPLMWEEAPHRMGSFVRLRMQADPAQRALWPSQHEWLAARLEALHRAFAPRIRSLDLGTESEPDAQPDEV